MPLSFPSNPSVGQQSTQNGRVFQWSANGAWEFYGNVNAHAANHASGGSDAISIAASQITSGSVPVDNGGTGATDAATARTNLGVVASTDARLNNGYGRQLLFG